MLNDRGSRTPLKKEDNKKLKPMKDIDAATVSNFFKSMVLTLPPLCFLGYLYGGTFGGKGGSFFGVILGVVASVFASLLAMYVSNRCGGAAAFLYKGSRTGRSIKEQLEGDLSQARFHKMNKRFDQAILKVDEVLEKIPGDAEALYLKASILWEGFHESVEAKRCLGVILKTTSKTDTYHTWASTFSAKIIEEEKNS